MGVLSSGAWCEAEVPMSMSWSSSSWMRKGSSRIARFLLVEHDVLFSSALFAFILLNLHDGYALVAHRVSFQLPSQYLKNSNPGLVSIPLLKYSYAPSLAFPHEAGAMPTSLKAFQSLRAFCPTLSRICTADPSVFSRYGCRSWSASDFGRLPGLFW